MRCAINTRGFFSDLGNSSFDEMFDPCIAIHQLAQPLLTSTMDDDYYVMNVTFDDNNMFNQTDDVIYNHTQTGDVDTGMGHINYLCTITMCIMKH